MEEEKSRPAGTAGNSNELKEFNWKQTIICCFILIVWTAVLFSTTWNRSRRRFSINSILNRVIFVRALLRITLLFRHWNQWICLLLSFVQQCTSVLIICIYTLKSKFTIMRNPSVTSRMLNFAKPYQEKEPNNTEAKRLFKNKIRMCFRMLLTQNPYQLLLKKALRRLFLT